MKEGKGKKGYVINSSPRPPHLYTQGKKDNLKGWEGAGGGERGGWRE